MHQFSLRAASGFLLAACFSTLNGASTAAEPAADPYRPLLHFTPAKNWMNDPNGMVFFEGEWHLFYQYNPEGDRWGHMSWGHAVSRDLLHWEHLPLALAEDKDVMIFSGSAVVDWKNTSGFGRGNKPPLVVIYTGHREGRQDQRLAYSNDRGRTWTKFDGNPVLDVGMADFRDPKVFWHEPTSRWIMTVALSTEHKVHFYASGDLKQWQYVGEFGPAGATGGLWECPDLFPLKAGEGTKWVLIVNINPGGPAGGSGCQYFVGDFDGSKFTADPPIASQAEFVPEGTVMADFESGYRGWTAEGTAFGDAPARGTLPNQMPVTGFRGAGLVNSFRDGDAAQGRLTSPPFDISADYISFLIGGGAHRETRVDLLVDGQPVRTATGREMERLSWQSWDVRDLRGKQATIQAVDEHSGGWGHINLDHVLMADQPARPADESPLWADYGPDFYAAVTWSDVPPEDGRRIWIGWMSNWLYANDTPTSPWRSAMTIPRELSLYETTNGWRLQQLPVSEFYDLARPQRGSIFDVVCTIAEANAWLRKERIGGKSYAIGCQIMFGAGPAGLKLIHGDGHETTITLDFARKSITLDRSKSGNATFHPQFGGTYTAPVTVTEFGCSLHVIVDACSVEVFVNEGEPVLTALIFRPTDSEADGVELFGDNHKIYPLAAFADESTQDN